MPEAAFLRGPRGSPHRCIEWSVAFAKRQAQVRPPSPTDTSLSATSVHGPQRRTIPLRGQTEYDGFLHFIPSAAHCVWPCWSPAASSR